MSTHVLYRKSEEINIQVDKAKIDNDISAKEIQKEVRTFFSSTQGHTSLYVDNMCFEPKPIVLLQIKQFNKGYQRQLLNILLNSQQQISQDLISLLRVFKELNKNNYPIRLVSGRHNKVLSKVCSSLNQFFNENYKNLYDIYTMFNSIKDTETEQQLNNKVKE